MKTFEGPFSRRKTSFILNLLKKIILIMTGVISLIFPIGITLAIIIIPTFFLWNWLVPIYFPFMPNQWLYIPFWNFAGLCAFIIIIKSLILISIKTK
jgi:hypothetical protein